MDCTKLHQDIAKLTRQKDQLETMLHHANETMQGKSELKSLISESESLETTILEDHLHAFAEKNPGLAQWQLGNLIPGFKKEDGSLAYIFSIASLPNGDALIGGGYGTLRICTKGEDGTYHLGDLIPGFKDKNGELEPINSIAPLPSGDMLIGGLYGDLRVCTKGEDSTYQLGGLIPGFKDKDGNLDLLTSIAPLPSGDTLIGGYDGTLRVCTKGEDGAYQLGDLIPGFEDKDGKLITISSIAPLPNGDVLIGGGSGTLREAHKPSLTVDTLRQNLDKLEEQAVNDDHIPEEQ